MTVKNNKMQFYKKRFVFVLLGVLTFRLILDAAFPNSDRLYAFIIAVLFGVGLSYIYPER